MDKPINTSIIVMIQKRTEGLWSRLTRVPRITLAQTIPTCATCIRYLNFNVDKPINTSIIVMIQKRTTTWFSFQPFNS